MKKINENGKAALTFRQLKRLVSEAKSSTSFDFEIKDGVLVKYRGKGGKVVIPNGVKSIGEGAFEDCSDLTSVTIPDSVTNIDICAFQGCIKLTTVRIPDSVTYIDEWAFAGCQNLTSVVIPDSVTNIGYCAFAYCDGLTSVTIGNGVNRIWDEAFRGCRSLTSVVIPKSVRIGKDAFAETPWHEKNNMAKDYPRKPDERRRDNGNSSNSVSSNNDSSRRPDPVYSGGYERLGPAGFWSPNIRMYEESMKKINENTKVTLTVAQIKKLVKESSISDYDITDYGEEMFPPDDDFDVKAREICKKWDEEVGLKTTKDFCQSLMFTLGRHIANGSISKEEAKRLLDDATYASMSMSDLYEIFWEGVENNEAAVAADIAGRRHK